MNPSQTRALLSALSAECHEMGAAVDGLSAVVFDHARSLPPEARAEALVQGQAVDALSQRLTALAALTAALSDGETVGAAIEALPLAGLAARLRAAVLDDPREPAAPAAGGDLVLFD